MNDPHLNEVMGYLPLTLEEQEDWYRTTLNTREKFIFAICLQSGNEHIGNVGLGRIDYIHRNAMLSIFIFDLQHHRQGFGKEAARLILQFAFGRLNLHKVTVQTSDFLHEAIAFYRRIGFREEGLLKEHEFKGGRYVDKHLFGITKTEFLDGFGRSDSC